MVFPVNCMIEPVNSDLQEGRMKEIARGILTDKWLVFRSWEMAVNAADDSALPKHFAMVAHIVDHDVSEYSNTDINTMKRRKFIFVCRNWMKCLHIFDGINPNLKYLKSAMQEQAIIQKKFPEIIRSPEFSLRQTVQRVLNSLSKNESDADFSMDQKFFAN